MKRPARRLTVPNREASWHNQNRDAIEDRTPLESKDIAVIDRPGAGFELVLKREAFGGGTSALKVQQMVIVTVARTTFTARLAPNGQSDPNSAPVTVTKPLNCIGDDVAPYNTKTVNLANPTATIVQTLTPGYQVGAFVYVVSGIENEGTKLEISPNREWVDALVLMCAKVNGVNKQVWVRASAPV